MAHVEGSGTGTKDMSAIWKPTPHRPTSSEKLQLLDCSFAREGDKFNVLFEQSILPFGQGLSPCRALRSSATTPKVLGSTVHEIEVMSACVYPSKEKSTPTSLLPVKVGKVMLPTMASMSVSTIFSTTAAREAEGAAASARPAMKAKAPFFVRITVTPCARPRSKYQRGFWPTNKPTSLLINLATPSFGRRFYWRPRPESNRGARICSPLRSHSATRPTMKPSSIARRGYTKDSTPLARLSSLFRPIPSNVGPGGNAARQAPTRPVWG